MQIFDLTEEQIISFLTRRAGIREDLMRLFTDTDNDFFVGHSYADAEILLKDDALCIIAEKLEQHVDYEYDENRNTTFAYFFYELYGKEYKIYCLFEGDVR